VKVEIVKVEIVKVEIVKVEIEMKEKTNWTVEQWDAITEKDCSLLVAAAAGAGKTAVLVERIIRN